MTVQEELTFKPGVLEEYLEQLPESLPVVQLAVMHPVARKKELKRLAVIEKRKQRKPYTRKAGCVHPKRKAATRRRRLEKKWASDPFWCVCHGYGAHAIDRELWDKYIQPFFEQYSPNQLKIEKHRKDNKGAPYGTKKNPYTVYSLRLIHTRKGVLLYDGASQELFDLSA